MRHAILALLALCCAGAVAGEGWLTNFEEAKTKAEKEKKPMLVDFTGSDWCGYCIRLHKSVFSQDAFKTYAKDKFILVELDFPRRKQIAAELKAQNRALAKKYSVRGYPTVLLMDAKGIPFAKTGYRNGGAEAYNKHLDALLADKKKFDATMKEADTAEGADKAAKLVAAIKLLNPALQTYYKDTVAQIKTLDPEDTTGFVKEQETKAALQKLGATVMGYARKKDGDNGNKAISAFLTEHKPEGQAKQQAVFMKVYFLPYPPKTTADCDTADKLMDEVVAIDEKSRIAMQCKRVKTQIAGMRKKLEAKAVEEKPVQPKPEDSTETE